MTRASVILWVGPKHSGKTTGATRLVERARAQGFVVAGCLAPAVYREDVLIGFDLVNLHSGARTTWARREVRSDTDRKFCFTAQGLRLGHEALAPAATQEADLIVIDEFGPLELALGGWRTATDRLMLSSNAVLLLVVREELAAEVQQLYRPGMIGRFVATQPESIAEVLTLLENQRR